MEGPDVVLRGERVSLRRPRPGELAEIAAAIAADPEAAAWWSTDPAKNLRWIEDPASWELIIESDSRIVGVLLVTEEEDPDYRNAAIDITLVGESIGKGLGPDSLRTIATYLFAERGHHRLTIDPAAANARAVRAYEKAGFRRVGLMRQYQRGPDGAWTDGLLMDMLREDFDAGAEASL
jgi:aminoglycoside 6'-N-acetyltransferase